MNQIFQNREEDGDILNTLMEIAEEYPILNVNKKRRKIKGGKNSKRSYNKTNKPKQTKKCNKKINKKSNKKSNKKTRKTRKTIK